MEIGSRDVNSKFLYKIDNYYDCDYGMTNVLGIILRNYKLGDGVNFKVDNIQKLGIWGECSKYPVAAYCVAGL